MNRHPGPHRRLRDGCTVQACMALRRSDSLNRTCLPTLTNAMRRDSTRRRTMRSFTARTSAACSIVRSTSRVGAATQLTSPMVDAWGRLGTDAGASTGWVALALRSTTRA